MSEINENEVGKRIGDISDLPDSVRDQLKFAQIDDLEQKILKTLNRRYGGIATIDEIIVGLYRDCSYETKDRRDVANKLYRMTKSGLLISVAGKRGVYSVTQVSKGM